VEPLNKIPDIVPDVKTMVLRWSQDQYYPSGESYHIGILYHTLSYVINVSHYFPVHVDLWLINRAPPLCP
jgi:hypothetical protein